MLTEDLLFMAVFIQCNFLPSSEGLHLEGIWLLILSPGKTYYVCMRVISEAYAKELGSKQCDEKLMI